MTLEQAKDNSRTLGSGKTESEAWICGSKEVGGMMEQGTTPTAEQRAALERALDAEYDGNESRGNIQRYEDCIFMSGYNAAKAEAQQELSKLQHINVELNCVALQAKEEIAGLRSEFGQVADIIEMHWRGAGLKLEAKWMVDEIAARGREDDRRMDEITKLETEIAGLRATLTELIAVRELRQRLNAAELARPLAAEWADFRAMADEYERRSSAAWDAALAACSAEQN